MTNSRSLEDLDPAAREICTQHLALCHAAGIELIVTSTYRDAESQDALYLIGRSGNDNRRPITNAKAGHSWHNFKVAWDVVPLVSGKPVWDENNPIWKEVIALGKEAGAEAGADWPLFKDLPHFQFIPTHDGLKVDLQQARALFSELGTIFI